MFVPNVFSFATEASSFDTVLSACHRHLGPCGMRSTRRGDLGLVKLTVESILRPEVLLDIAQNFTLFATDNNIAASRSSAATSSTSPPTRSLPGSRRYPKKGLIWHFQGSAVAADVFAALKLRMHPKLGSPTVIIVVDRIDLDTQITATFNAADVPTCWSGNAPGVADLLGQTCARY